MPAPVHAVIVAHPDARAAGLPHLKETLAAVAAQRHPVDALTIVLCGKDRRFAELVDASGAEGIIQADAATGFAEAIELASRRVDPDHALWLLAQDTVPAPDALERLAAVLELQPSVAVVAPKLVRRSNSEIIASLGVSMSRGGESVELAAGQFDQGQHDGREDVLGADIRGVLLRAERRADLLPDRALGGADEGLDIGVRARLGGDRVALAPAARVAVRADGVAGLPDPVRAADRRRIVYVTRLAQLHRRLVYAPAAVVPLHILSFLPIALWRAISHLLAKAPGAVLPEWAAAFVAAFRWPSIARSRTRLRGRRGDWWRVDPLRISRVERREILLGDGESARTTRPELRFFSGGGAWVVMASLAVSIVAFFPLLSWPVLGGGGALPLRTQLTSLWGDAVFGARGYGLDGALPADPFSALLAVLGSLMPAAPSSALVVLWLAALPLATLGGWFAATRVTERSGLRIAGAVLWTVAPTFLGALVDPRPAAVILHLALPWLVYTGLAAHRSWGSAGAASLLMLVVAACAPSAGGVLAVIVVVAAVVAICVARFSGAVRLLWTLVPTLVFFLPLIWFQVGHKQPLNLLADPGLPYQGARTSDDLWGRLALLAGFPAGDAGGWPDFLASFGAGDEIVRWAWFAPVLVIPVVLLAGVGAFTVRWRVGAPLLLAAGGAAVAGLLASGISVSVVGGSPVALWPGSLGSVSWLAFVLAALLALHSLRMPRSLRGALGAIAVVLVLAIAVPQLAAVLRGDATAQNGPRSTLPAYVAAELDEGARGATLVLDIQDDGTVVQRVVWGSSDSLGAQSTVLSTQSEFSAAEEDLAGRIADAMTPQAQNVTFADLGIRFVLIEPVTATSGPAAALRAQAVAAFDRNSAFTAVGETGKGALWGVTGEVAPRPALTSDDRSLSAIATIAALVSLVIAVLLAIPTRASVRAARVRPRMIGASKEQE